MKVKFCGLSREQDIKVVNELAPDYVGFVFWQKSKRYVDKEQAGRLREMLRPGILAVGVFLDEDVEVVAGILNAEIVDIAQLHGHEDEAYIGKLRNLCNKPVIKAFNVVGENNIRSANLSSADYVLLDSKVAGSGNTFNWDFVKGIERPFFLAGGLNPENIAEVIKINPYAVDVSSGIETDGVKDAEKMREFMNIVRSN